MYRIVAVGEKDLVLAFRGAGANLEIVTSGDQLEEVLTKLSKDSSVALVLVTESVAAKGTDAITDFRLRSSIPILVVPSHEGSQHLSILEMKKYVERAVGVDMIKDIGE
jgi:V/A-type H+-transporting ATPase subunit F